MKTNFPAYGLKPHAVRVRLWRHLCAVKAVARKREALLAYRERAGLNRRVNADVLLEEMGA